MRKRTRALSLAFAMGLHLFAANQWAHITLDNALWRSADAGKGEAIYLTTTLRDGTDWGWVMGTAPSFNRGSHRGRILEGTLNGGSLKLEMDVKGDPWVPGGWLQATLNLKKGEDGWTGSYTGDFRGIKIKGTARATLTPPLSPREDYIAPTQHEHPRMFFRKADLPALKAKAETPIGKALVEKMKHSEDMLAKAMMFQLTGDKSYATGLIPKLEQMMEDESPGAFRGSDGAYARRVAKVAMVYDLCYDGWPKDFQQRATAYFGRRMNRMLFRPHSITSKFNWAPNSNYSGHMNGAAGIAGLLVYDKPGAKPTPPRDPGHEPKHIKPDSDYVVPEGVPVSDVVYDWMAEEWIYAGHFPNRDNKWTDPFAAQGGFAKARPKLGDEIEFDGVKHSFAVLPEVGYWKRRNKKGETFLDLELMGLTKKAYYSTTYFYTVYRMTEAATVQLQYNPSGLRADFWIAGERVYSGDFIQLEPGLYPMLVRAHMGKVNSWGKAWCKPRFVATTEEEVKEGIAKQRIRFHLDTQVYQEDLAYWKANKGASPVYKWLYLCGVKKASDYHRYTFGNGGFQVEGEIYTSVGVDEPLRFENFHKTAIGHPSTGRPDVSTYGPRFIAQTIYGEAGPKVHQSFSLTDGTLPLKRFSIAYPCTVDKWKPVMLWAWNKSLGLADGGAGKSAAERGDAQDLIAALEKNPVWNFLYYPLDMVPEAPNGENFPKAYEAETKGLYVFRNEWSGPEDIVAQFFLKSEGEGGWQNPDGASLRLYGLGHIWTHRGQMKGKVRQRWHETVVHLPDDDYQDGGRATKIAYQADANGGGSVHADLAMIYSGKKRQAHPKTGKMRALKATNNMFELLPKNLVDLGISGTRSVGVDYSGKAGAPGLFVIRDAVSGGGKKLWQWQIPEDTPLSAVKTEERGFTITQADGAHLRATFLSPTKLSIVVSSESISYVPAGDKYKRKPKKFSTPLRAVHVWAAGDDKEGDFLVVITLQRGNAPRVAGTPTEFTVGKQTVTWTGSEFVFGE